MRSAAEGCTVGYQGRGGPRADAVIHVHDREAGGAGLEHPEDSRGAVAAKAVSGGGWESYDRDRYEARDHARQGPLHPGGDDHDIGVEVSKLLQRGREAVDTSHPNVVKAHNGCAHLTG